jgi:hypothetical protein
MKREGSKSERERERERERGRERRDYVDVFFYLAQ